MPATSRITRPGTLVSARQLDDDTIAEPLSVIGDALFTAATSWWEVQAAWAAGGALGGFETVALIGSILTGTGALALGVVGVAALVLPEVRSQLAATNKIAGVVMSPGGLPIFVVMEATGHSTNDSLGAGELGRAAFSEYSGGRALKQGIKNWKQAASFVNNVKDVIDYARGGDDDSGASPDGGESEGPTPRGEVMLWDDGHLIYDGPPALANDAGSRAKGNSANPGPGGGQSADPPGSGEVGDAPGDDSSGDGKPGLGEVPVREPD